MLSLIARRSAAVELEVEIRRSLPTWVCAFGSARGMLADGSACVRSVRSKLSTLAIAAGADWRDAIEHGARAGLGDARFKGEPVMDGAAGWTEVLVEQIEIQIALGDLQRQRVAATAFHARHRGTVKDDDAA
jgi:hypothetical protein